MDLVEGIQMQKVTGPYGGHMTYPVDTGHALCPTTSLIIKWTHK